MKPSLLQKAAIIPVARCINFYLPGCVNLQVPVTITLNAIFLEFSRRAAINMNEHIHATEAYTRMALKAQNQVRLTLETIKNMRNPPMVIAKQANITTGPQQVNNVLSSVGTTPLQNEPNQLSEALDDELRQDTRA